MMLRTFAGVGAALALVGSAHAQDPSSVTARHATGRAAVRQDLYRAAQAACLHGRAARALRDVTCVDETYRFNLYRLDAAAARPQQTAMQTRLAPVGLR
jgi:hypothetical protein